MSAAASTWATRLSRSAIIAGGLGMVALVAGGVLNADQFFRSYLLGFLFCFQIAFGCLAIQLIHAITGGRWGALIRRPMYAASTTFPALAVLFVPVLLGVHRLYPWARPEAAGDAIVHAKSAYLNVPFFVGRAALFFALFTVVALALYKRAAARIRQRGGADFVTPSRAMRRLAGPAAVVCGFGMTFAAIDWMMSLDPHWFSTMFGLLVVGGTLLAGMCFAVVTLTAHAKHEGEEVSLDALQDVGNLMLVFVMLWAYFAYSQYLVIYAGNMADDVPFYVRRERGGYQYVALALIVLHFAVPFLILLSRRSKRSLTVLPVLAAGLLVMRLVDVYWQLAPNFYGRTLRVHWMDLVAVVGVGGLWLWYFLRQFERSALVRADRPEGRTPAGDGGEPKPRAA